MTKTAPGAVPVDAADDYSYRLHVHAGLPRVVEALTDHDLIGRWWTVVTGSEQQGDEVTLFMGGGEAALVFTVEHAPGTRRVSWAVTSCRVIPDWVGTQPSFSMQPNDDGTCEISFRHIGLVPELECFDQCRAGWNHFVPSLQQFLETGVGRPNEPREPRRASA